MKNTFEIICKKCGGKCCKSTIFLTQRDIDKWKQFEGEFKVKEKGAGFMLIHEGQCPFLNEETGCTLEENLKAFDCILFPLAFIYKNEKIKFYLNKKCPYVNKIQKDWIEKTKKWALEQLKSWNEEEKRTYSKIIENYPVSELISI